MRYIRKVKTAGGLDELVFVGEERKKGRKPKKRYRRVEVTSWECGCCENDADAICKKCLKKLPRTIR